MKTANNWYWLVTTPRKTRVNSINTSREAIGCSKSIAPLPDPHRLPLYSLGKVNFLQTVLMGKGYMWQKTQSKNVLFAWLHTLSTVNKDSSWNSQVPNLGDLLKMAPRNTNTDQGKKTPSYLIYILKGLYKISRCQRYIHYSEWIT